MKFTNRTGMFVYAIIFLLGILSAQQLSILPDISYNKLLIVQLIFIILLLYQLTKKPPHKPIFFSFIVILFFMTGFLTCIISAKQQLSSQLPAHLVGKTLIIEGEITGLVDQYKKSQKFLFTVDTCFIEKNNQTCLIYPNVLKKIKLSWYYSTKILSSNERWQFSVRLKQPHGFLNPGGFDYESWLFQQHISATGYVKKSAKNQLKKTNNQSNINAFRQRLVTQIDNLAKHSPQNKTNLFSVIKALAVGDKSSINKQQWQIFRNTGTSHLVAISGLHIGLAALFSYLLIRWIVFAYITPSYLVKRYIAQNIAMIAGLCTGFTYALIAGFSIPTQRATIMLVIVSIMLLIKRNNRAIDGLGFALLLVLIIEPFATLSAGFWFSFTAVVIIFMSIDWLNKINKNSPLIKVDGQYKPLSLIVKFKRIIKKWIIIQIMIFVFLFPLSIFMFQQVSLVAPLANLILIPYISFFVVPIVLLAIIFSLLWLPSIANILFTFANYLLVFIWQFVDYLSQLEYAKLRYAHAQLTDLLFASTVLLLLFYSKKLLSLIQSPLTKRQFNLLHLLLCSVLIILFGTYFIANTFFHQTRLNKAEFSLTVLDVGQGSAAVITTKNHTLVFDTGAKFSERFGIGQQVIIPYLQSQKIKTLDTLLISHGDADHIGGAQSLVNHYKKLTVIGQDLDKITLLNTEKQSKQTCYKGQQWWWDKVHFEILWPPKAISRLNNTKRNNYSCVLKVSSIYGNILLTGDIETWVEQQLVTQYNTDNKKLQADVLVVPHHGSKTSSSQVFIDAINPKLSIISVGYNNKYHLPAKKIICRYLQMGRPILLTRNTGAITVHFSHQRAFSQSLYRKIISKFWHYQTKPISNELLCSKN